MLIRRWWLTLHNRNIIYIMTKPWNCKCVFSHTLQYVALTDYKIGFKCQQTELPHWALVVLALWSVMSEWSVSLHKAFEDTMMFWKYIKILNTAYNYKRAPRAIPYKLCQLTVLRRIKNTYYKSQSIDWNCFKSANCPIYGSRVLILYGHMMVAIIYLML